jgi:hypothetical protein
VVSPQLPATVMVAKPSDETIDKWNQVLGWKEHATWPPPHGIFTTPPEGQILWPRHGLKDLRADNTHLRDQFTRCMLDQYGHSRRKGLRGTITVADEYYALADLDHGAPPGERPIAEMTDAMLTRGYGMKAGLWYGNQKGSGTQRVQISTFAYNSPSWIFMSYDPTEFNRRRLGEIGGADAKLVENTVAHLPRRHWLVFHRESGGLVIIGPLEITPDCTP